MKPIRRVAVLGAGTLLAALGFSQTLREKEATFEVASVKAVAQDSAHLLPIRNRPFPVDELMRMRGGPGTEDPGRIGYLGVTMRMLVRRAYGLRFYQIAGPGWLDEQRYDVVANVPPGTDNQRLGLMLRSLLTERFQMQVHREKKTKSVYALVVARNGTRLKPAETPRQPKDTADAAGLQGNAMGRLAAQERGMSRFQLPHASVAEFIDSLSPAVDRPVVDRTELRGTFGFTLSYFREFPGGGADSDVPRGPPVFEAVKAQLGLELVPTKDDVEILVLDRVSRFPTGN